MPTTETLIQHTLEGAPLNSNDSRQLFQALMAGELSSERMAGILIALKIRGETHHDLIGAVQACRDIAQPFPRPEYPFADIVGTGGDGAHSLNISTTAAILAASMGYPIAKHGNRSVSSLSGASDILQALNINIAISPEQARHSLDSIGLCFLWAQQYHTGFRHIAPVRQALKTRTLFNLLGPLINPARPPQHILGVYHTDILPLYAESLRDLGTTHSIIVHGSGLDEVAIHADTDIAEVRGDSIEYYRLTPNDFGLPTHALSELNGGDPKHNAMRLSNLLQGNEPNSAYAHAVAANVALLMKTFGKNDLPANTAAALAHLNSGAAWQTLEHWRRHSQENHT